MSVPADWPPTLTVVIDTEEEFDWRAPPDPSSRSVTNIRHQPLLQAVFDRHGVRPAYLVDHPVATSPEAVAILRAWADEGRCEIGAHLHPWVTPPVEEKVDFWHAFAANLPPGLERRKIETLTRAIEQAFGRAPLIFKAGAYGLSPFTTEILAEFGYTVDTSVVPFTSFENVGGPDFSSFSPRPLQTGPIVELPLSVGFAGQFAGLGPQIFPVLSTRAGRGLHLPGFAARLGLMERLRLTPEGHTLAEMTRLTRAALARGERLFMLTLHSSSLLPGATEYVRTEAARDEFLRRIDQYLDFFHRSVAGRSALVSDVAAQLARSPRHDAPLEAAGAPVS